MHSQITTLFVDIGGVLLTNGWDHHSRQRAAETFGLDYEEMSERHHLTFDIYEEGKLSLDEYLKRVVFYRERSFSREEFKKFMYAQSKPYPEMIQLIRGLKSQYGLRVAAVSNEGRELTMYRVQEFDLRTFVDFFVSSCFVHYRKPDEDMYRIALDISQSRADQVVYLDDRGMFVEVARELGLAGIVHTGYEPTPGPWKGWPSRCQTEHWPQIHSAGELIMKKNGKAVQSDALVLFGVTGDSGQPQLLWLNTKNASQTRLSIELISIWKLRVEHEKSI